MPDLASPLIEWYRENARDLPWRRDGFGAWGVLVSEFMLQQTPVSRVIPHLTAWLERWPTPADLAAAAPADAVHQWANLGYPRRALWLHRAAVEISERHGNVVPRDVDDLLALTGIGDYTARAVAVFAYGDRHPVVDTNTRRVLARAVEGRSQPGPPAKADLAAMETLLPRDTDDADGQVIETSASRPTDDAIRAALPQFCGDIMQIPPIYSAIKIAGEGGKRPGLILADIQLADGSSGLDAVNDLLKTFEVPVIFITAYPERFLTGERPEPAFLIAKPLQPANVSAVISQALFFQQTARRREAKTA